MQITKSTVDVLGFMPDTGCHEGLVTLRYNMGEQGNPGEMHRALFHCAAPAGENPSPKEVVRVLLDEALRQLRMMPEMILGNIKPEFADGADLRAAA